MAATRSARPPGFGYTALRLGSGLISAHPQASRSQGEGAKEIARELVEAGGDASEVLELAEEALDQIALSVDAAVDRSVDDPLAG